MSKAKEGSDGFSFWWKQEMSKADESKLSEEFEEAPAWERETTGNTTEDASGPHGSSAPSAGRTEVSESIQAHIGCKRTSTGISSSRSLISVRSKKCGLDPNSALRDQGSGGEPKTLAIGFPWSTLESGMSGPERLFSKAMMSKSALSGGNWPGANHPSANTISANFGGPSS